MTDCPAAAAAPNRPAITSLHSVDDACLIVDLLGSAAAGAVRHLPVATLLDASGDELEQFGLVEGMGIIPLNTRVGLISGSRESPAVTSRT